MRRSILILLLLLGAACGPGFEPSYKIEKPRVVGAFVSVDGDPLRSTPAPEETATLTLVTADPGAKSGRTYALVVCRQGDSNFDIVYCSDTSTFLGTNLVTTLPAMGEPKPDPFVTFTVPDEATLGDETEVWVFGAVCNGGVARNILTDPPEIGTEWDPCLPVPADQSQPYGQLISTRLPIMRTALEENNRPSLASLTFDGADWSVETPDDAPATGCAGQGYIEIHSDSTPKTDASLRTIVGTALPNDRETYLDELRETERVEDLFLRFYISAGKLDATYDAIDDGDPEATIRYRPPRTRDVAADGTLVRFTLYMQDDRQATSWYRRAICVLP